MFKEFHIIFQENLLVYSFYVQSMIKREITDKKHDRQGSCF